MNLREELEELAFDKYPGGWSYSPDIRVAALAALVELEKVERTNEKTCNCPDSPAPHTHHGSDYITNTCCGDMS